MVTYTTFKTRVEYNTQVLLDALEQDLPLCAILHKVYTWEYEPGEAHFSILMRNAHDIIPSLFLGVLANCDNNGIDAFEIQEDESVIEIEIKTSEVRSNKIWSGPQGGLYTGIQNTKTRRAALTSGLAASYTCHTEANKLSKNMRTVFMMTDTNGPNTYIDAYELEGEAVLKYLNLSDCKSRGIKLGSFMKEGRRCKTAVELEGFENFRDRIGRTAKILAKDEYFVLPE